MKCENCDEDLYGPQLYCAKCGQKNISKLNLRYLFSEIIDAVFNLDSKLYRTVKVLILKPGALSREFVKGRRKSYVSPVRLYVAVTLIFFFMLSIMRFFSDEKGSILTPDDTLELQISDSTWTIKYEEYKRWESTMGMENYLKDSLQIDDFTGRWIAAKTIKNAFNPEVGSVLIDRLSIFLFLFIPLIALIYKWSFIYNKFGYYDHLVFNLHFNSFIIILAIIYRILTLLVTIKFGGIILFFGTVVYLYIALIKFYERKWWVALYKLLVLAVGYGLLTIVLAGIWLISTMLFT